LSAQAEGKTDVQPDEGLRSKSLRDLEAEILAEGREWTRQRMEERLQKVADEIGDLSPPSTGNP
jgi:hypothetical protein